MNIKHSLLIFTLSLQTILIFAYNSNISKKESDVSIQNDPLINDSINPVNKYKINRKSILWLSLQGANNVTRNDMTLFYYADGTEIPISRNGIYGAGLVIGYKTRINVDFSIGYYIYTTSLEADIDNASATFNRQFLNPVLKYALETLNKRNAFNFGIGLLLSNQPMLDIDGSQVPDGSHNQFIYKNGVGTSLHFEWQSGSEAESPVIFKLYLKYTLMTYNLKTAMLDGINWPIDQLPEDLNAEVGQMNTNGLEIGVGIGFRLFRH
jgi:hypothetical protein